MKSHLALHLFGLLTPIFGLSHAALPSDEGYWNSVLPGVPMPLAIQSLLDPVWVDDWGTRKPDDECGEACRCAFEYSAEAPCEASSIISQYKPSTNLFFFEKDLQLGSSKSFYFATSSNPASFLPRKYADLVPFTSEKLPELMDTLLIKPASPDAKKMRDTVKFCEVLGQKKEDEECVTSLASMIDFSTLKLGSKKVEAIASEIAQETEPQKYSIVGLKSMENDRAVACHKLDYPYAVYACHSTTNIRAHKVSLVGAGGNKVRAIAVCHQDTSSWNPDHLAFHVLNIKPGTAPICHFLPGDHIAWIPK